VTYSQRHLCPAPSQQGIIDLQSGILHADRGALQNFIQLLAYWRISDPKAISSLKYVLLCKIMVSQVDDFAGIISLEGRNEVSGSDVYAMKAMADAYSKRLLKYFETAIRNYKSQLEVVDNLYMRLAKIICSLLLSV
jgi:26S proteasome regulatory subunit N6